LRGTESLIARAVAIVQIILVFVMVLSDSVGADVRIVFVLLISHFSVDAPCNFVPAILVHRLIILDVVLFLSTFP